MITKEIELFLQKFLVLTENEKKELAKKMNVQGFKKKTILQEEGKIPQKCFFVLKGLVKLYEIVDGIKKTTDFYSEFHPAISSDCYFKNIPSEIFLECVEDSLLIIGEEPQDSKLMKEFPVLQGIMMQIMEEEWLKTKKRLSTFKLSSPEKRYISFLNERSDLKDRVSNSQIASYLGIAPESLSRIRKRLSIKSKN